MFSVKSFYKFLSDGGKHYYIMQQIATNLEMQMPIEYKYLHVSYMG